MEDISLRRYLDQALTARLLNREEEEKLAQKIRLNDSDALEELIKANLRLVVKIAKGFEDRGLPLLDLINEGNMGLMEAAKRFEPAKGAKFSTYASIWIKQKIRLALATQVKQIAISPDMGKKIARYNRALDQYMEKYGCEPSINKLALLLNESVETIQRWRETSWLSVSSLEETLGNGPESSKYADVIPDPNTKMPWEEVDEGVNFDRLRELIDTLSPRERSIIILRYGLDNNGEHTFEEIGNIFGFTREYARQIERTAFFKLRTKIREQDAIASLSLK